MSKFELFFIWMSDYLDEIEDDCNPPSGFEVGNDFMFKFEEVFAGEFPESAEES